MKRLFVLVFLIAFPVALFATPIERYIVRTTHPYGTAVRMMRTVDFDVIASREARIREFSIINGFAADLTNEQATQLLRSGEVEDIEPVLERHVFADTVTPGQQTTPYGVMMVNAPAVWPVTKGAAINGSGPIHMAIIDTGIDYHSTELQRAYRGGFNFINGTTDPLDDFGHGSHVAGIIAAADDRNGVVGVAPDVDIYSLKVLDQCGSGSTETIIAAIDWIKQKKSEIGGNWIVNLSLGSSDSSNAEKTAFQKGADAGIIFFAAAGNSYDDSTSAFFHTDGLAFPAGYPSVVSVGAIDSTMTVATFSQRGAGLKVVAPGVSVLSTIVSVGVSTNDGRAFAGTTPVVVKDDQGDPLDGFCLPAPNASGTFVFCGLGNPSEFPSSVSGKIALIERGTLHFIDKMQNAKAAGATGVILYNNVADPPLITPALGNFTTAGTVPTFVPTIFLTQADGLALKATPAANVSLGFGLESWELESGTSMATPHAAAVAALVWAVAPNASATDVTNAVINDAKDLGDAGTDTVYGHGLVNALDAAKQLNPGAFGPPAPTPPTGRAPGRGRH